MHTHHSKLWQTLLGSLVLSCLACGGSSGSGGAGHDGGLDGGGTALDGAPRAADLALLIDQAGSTIDQAPPRIDQAPASLDLGTRLDGDADANADVRTGDTLVTPDVPMQSDLPATPDVFVYRDLPATRDVTTTPDLPLSDVPLLGDLPPALDVSVAVDLAADLDGAAILDSSPGLDTTTPLDATAVDTDPNAPVVAPDKLTYAKGEALTATYANGSTDSTAWIGIFLVGVPDSMGMERDWKYTSGQTASTMLLHVPGTAGTYELRMFRDNGYERIATSVPFTVVP